MGVYIRGMEMPKACLFCELYEADLYWCRGAKRDVVDSETVADFCPILPVPPHGRLIDADALRESFRESIEECHKWADEVDKDTMMYARISQSLGTFVECSLRTKAAPTIIESEEST